MIGTLLKSIVWAILIVSAPILVFVLYAIWPFLAVILVIFLPFILIGVAMGYQSGKAKTKAKKESNEA